MCLLTAGKKKKKNSSLLNSTLQFVKPLVNSQVLQTALQVKDQRPHFTVDETEVRTGEDT